MTCKNNIKQLLAEKPMTVRQIAEVTGHLTDTVNLALRKMVGEAYICDWEKNRMTYSPIWALGDKPHVSRPQSDTKGAIEKRTRLRQKSRASYLRSDYVASPRIWSSVIPGGL